MVHLEIVNKPKKLGGKELIHRNITCIAFEHDVERRRIAIYEERKHWIDRRPSYYFVEVIKVTYWNDEGGNNA